jgi:hypothetical protein
MDNVYGPLNFSSRHAGRCAKVSRNFRYTGLRRNLISALRCSDLQPNENAGPMQRALMSGAATWPQFGNLVSGWGVIKWVRHCLPQTEGNSSETANTRDVEGSNASGVRTVGERSDRAEGANHAGQDPDGCQMQQVRCVQSRFSRVRTESRGIRLQGLRPRANDLMKEKSVRRPLAYRCRHPSLTGALLCKAPGLRARRATWLSVAQKLIGQPHAKNQPPWSTVSRPRSWEPTHGTPKRDASDPAVG